MCFVKICGICSVHVVLRNEATNPYLVDDWLALVLVIQSVMSFFSNATKTLPQIIKCFDASIHDIHIYDGRSSKCSAETPNRRHL